ncbi:nacht and wd domain protein [Apiospora arundinis]|uniref:Nacht and wd domain protein n=1 Tax=Apiospora arundinis TaxID=335852 RepID=A0ABR2J602_9PEZI
MWRKLRDKAKSSSEVPSDSVTPGTSDNQSPPEKVPNTPITLTDRRHSSNSQEALKEPQPRRASERSNLSDVHGQLVAAISPNSSHRRQRSEERREDPLGLHVLHLPDHDRTVDIIFIHGLGGTSRRTWSKNRDLNYLWPQLWLPNEPEFSRARILTFGYNAHYASKTQASLSINDFAKDLLFRLRYGESGAERMGQVPIVVVAHSMGGLIFKRAYIQGQQNEEFQPIVASIRSVLFLSTPHRGTDLADTLNKILSSSIFGHSSKDYINELTQNSPTIDELNESFRHYAGNLRIFSFYETLSTSIGPKSVKVLEKNSSTLGYPNETSQPLNADHHEVCKFASPNDPNYQSVIGALRSVVQPDCKEIDFRLGDYNNDMVQISKMFGLTSPPHDDLASLRDLRRPGTCEGLYHDDQFSGWLESSNPHSRILWIHAKPGSGKSVQASLIIDRLLEDEKANCSYYFFKYSDENRRSLGQMFRSLAFQMASHMPSFRQALSEMSGTGTDLKKADGPTVWRTIFKGVLANISLPPNIFWIIDGLDESESSRTFVDLISEIRSFKGVVRVIVLSRPLSHLAQAFQRAKRTIDVTALPLPSNLRDIEKVAAEEIEYLIPNQEFRDGTVKNVMRSSEGSFLWVSLVIERISRCHRQDDVLRVLESTPSGMNELYERMVSTVSKLEIDEEIQLARILLSWATYAKRPLAVEELRELHNAQLSRVMDLKHTATEVCGQLVVIDSQSQVSLVHHTAREYLRSCKKLPFDFSPRAVHEDLFLKCFGLLLSRNLRTRIAQGKTPRFLSYAAIAWMFHLNMCSAESDRVLDTLVKFFQGANLLAWTQWLAMKTQLFDLIAASKAVNEYLQRRKRVDANRAPLLHRLTDIALLETWVVDLLKIAAKFGSHLLEDPSIIYTCVAPLSPTSSNMHQQFAGSAASISVSGLTNNEWDDCLARVSGGSSQTMQVDVGPQYLAVADDSPQGNITLWNTTLFQECRTLCALEPIFAICFSPSGACLASYGISMTRVWKVSDGALLTIVDNPHRARAISMKFTSETGLILATDLRDVYHLTLDQDSAAWVAFESSLLEETTLPEGAFLNSPSSVAFNNDSTQMAVAYRGFPLSVWNIDPPVMVARCRRRTKQGQTTNNMWTGVNRVVFHPFSGHVFGIYRDGNIFKWLPASPGLETHEEVKQELDATPNEISIAPNGLVFATSDVKGAVKVYDSHHMALIYKLSSEDIIKKILFSPDSRRFYDLRGSYCNVWEPNCLMRLVDVRKESSSDDDSIAGSEWEIESWSDGDDSRSASISFTASETYAESKPAITAIAIAGKGDLLAYGNDSGALEIYNATSDTKHHVVQSTFGSMGIGHIAWSYDNKFLAYSLLNGRIAIKSLEQVQGAKNPKQALRVKNLLTEKGQARRGAPQQLLFDRTAQHLFVAGTEKLQIFSIPSCELICEREANNQRATKWMLHPADPEMIVAVSATKITGHQWSSLEIRYEMALDLQHGSPDSSPDSPMNIEDLRPSYSPNMVLAITSLGVADHHQHQFALLDTSLLRKPTDQWPKDPIVRSISIPDALLAAVERPLGLLADGRLAFLDQSLWVCTAQVLPGNSSNIEQITKHFFLPRDWINAAGLKMCQILGDGSFVCPSKGELALIRSDMGSACNQPVNNDIEPSSPQAVSSRATLSYSAFQPWQKRWIIVVVAFGGWFSSLSSFIYFPAIPALSADLGVSVEKINLTVTSYLIMSGIFPALVGNAADKLGRRPVFLATLAVYVGANIGLALQNSFGLLFFLRMLQSAGISETSRAVVGNGSIRPTGVYRALIPVLAPPSSNLLSPDEEDRRVFLVEKPKKSNSVFPNPLACLLLLRHRRTAIVASLSTLFTDIYHVSGLVSGLTYLPFGVACAVAAFGTGKVLDRDYRHTTKKEGIPVDKTRGDDADLSRFPIEHARLRSVKFSVALCAFFIAGYGWSLQQRTGLSTLLVDIHPEASATAQAANNFIRCEMAAAGLALLDVMLRGMGPGWTFVLFAGLGWVVAAMLWMLDAKGLAWRRKETL